MLNLFFVWYSISTATHVRRVATTLTFFVILLTSVIGWSQSQVPTENEVWQLCKPPAYWPSSDTLARQATLDSMRVRIAGHRKLMERGTGWSSPTKPYNVVELGMEQQGKGLIYEQGQLVSKIQLTLSRSYDLIFFKIKQQGPSVFHFSRISRHGGLIGACEKNLVIGDGMADGTAFAFRRIQQ